MAERPRDTFLSGQGETREFVTVPNRDMPPPREPRPYDSPRWPAKPEPVQVTGYEPQRPREPQIDTTNLPDWMMGGQTTVRADINHALDHTTLGQSANYLADWEAICAQAGNTPEYLLYGGINPANIWPK